MKGGGVWKLQLLTHNVEGEGGAGAESLRVGGLAGVLARGVPGHLLQDQALGAHDDPVLRVGQQLCALQQPDESLSTAS